MSDEKPKIAGPWASDDVHNAYRADLRWSGDWAFGVWEAYDPSSGEEMKHETWRLRWWWCKHRTTGGYCDTKQEAMDAADKYARENGWALQ